MRVQGVLSTFLIMRCEPHKFDVFHQEINPPYTTHLLGLIARRTSRVQPISALVRMLHPVLMLASVPKIIIIFLTDSLPQGGVYSVQNIPYSHILYPSALRISTWLYVNTPRKIFMEDGHGRYPGRNCWVIKLFRGDNASFGDNLRWLEANVI